MFADLTDSKVRGFELKGHSYYSMGADVKSVSTSQVTSYIPTTSSVEDIYPLDMFTDLTCSGQALQTQFSPRQMV